MPDCKPVKAELMACKSPCVRSCFTQISLASNKKDAILPLNVTTWGMERGGGIVDW